MGRHEPHSLSLVSKMINGLKIECVCKCANAKIYCRAYVCVFMYALTVFVILVFIVVGAVYNKVIKTSFGIYCA